MHIVMFGDQHVESQGGAQVSMRLQRRYLECAGHVVSIVQPAMRGASRDPAYVDLPSLPITPDREYGVVWPGRRADRAIDRALAARPPVDVVHVQADFWGGFLGHRFARRHGLPVVHTMHNRVDVGIRAVSPLPGPTLRALNLWQRRALPPLPGGPVPHGADGWSYLAGLAAGADAVTAPSSHWARRLEENGVFGAVDVVWNGIDDEMLDAVLAEPRPPARARPRFVWLGRMSPEKRLLPFLDAVADSGIDADVDVIGGGAQLSAARRLVARRNPTARVEFAGRLAYPDVLRRIADADAVVLISLGFETQGMTVFEAATLGTPAVVVDPDIAAELGGGRWLAEHPDALAATLARAAADIAAGRAPAIDRRVAEEFRQSSRTAAMIAVYERVTRSG